MALFRRRKRLAEAPRARSVTALVCLALMLVSVNVLAARFLPLHLDLTAERLYTLSEGTRRTLARIDEPITLRFYYSSQLGAALPAYAAYAQRVRELLDQYVTAAHGKIRLEIYDPQPFSAAEDRAVASGLQGVPLDAKGDQVYFGLAGTNSTDDRQVIAFFSREREQLLEYDLTRLVHALAVPQRPLVGLISSLPLAADPLTGPRGEAAPPLAILHQLRQLDDIRPLPTALDAIPAGIDVLMLVHPQKLPEKTLFAIDQFVLAGGKALVFVDPYSELQERGEPLGTLDSNLEPLFKAWGLRLVPGMIAADRRDARRVVIPKGAGGGAPLPYIAWLDLKGDELNRHDVITASLREVTMATPGVIAPLKGAATDFEPLITTSPDAMEIPAEKVAGLPDIVGLLIGFKPANTRYALAARITGPAETAFPEGPPKPAAKASAPATKTAVPAQSAAAAGFLRKSVRPINVVVVADTDLLDDRFWAQTENFFGRQVIVPVANNGDFVANAIDVLGGGEDLINLRSRGTSARPFTVVARMQRAADARYAAEQRTLEEKLKATQAKLQQLTAGGPPNAAAETALSPDQQKAIEQFRTDILKTRRQLRDVQRALRHDIERLETVVEFADIALMPILVAGAAIVLAAFRRRRWRRQPPPALA